MSNDQVFEINIDQAKSLFVISTNEKSIKEFRNMADGYKKFTINLNDYKGQLHTIMIMENGVANYELFESCLADSER